MSSGSVSAVRSWTGRGRTRPPGSCSSSASSRGTGGGVGAGSKSGEGKETDEPAVIVFVERKLPEDRLRKEDVIPKALDEVKTDVIETGKIKAQAAAPRARTDRWRPAPGGGGVRPH